MFLTFIHICVSTDDIDSDIHRIPHEWYTYQREVMHRLIQYGRIDPLLNEENFPARHNINEVCRWTGVSCMNNIIIRIEWRQPYAVILDTRWFPAHTIIIQLHRQKTAGPLETNALPRHVDKVAMEYCGIPGEIDLTCLPPKIKILKLSGNSIDGSVNMLYLPESVRVIDLSGNRIVKAYGTDGCLPEGLESIDFHSSKIWTKYIALDGSTKDARIKAVRIALIGKK